MTTSVAAAASFPENANDAPWPAPPPPAPPKRKRHLRLIDPRRMTDEELAAELEQLIAAEERKRYIWARWARPDQLEPAFGYRVWLIMSGRGWGKTRTGAETVRSWAMARKGNYAVIAKSHREVQSICFDGPAGLLSVIPAEDVLQYKRGSGDVQLILRNGSVIRAFSAEDPDVFRGYAFDGVWCDEYAAWHRRIAQAVYDMLWFCLRESPDPRIVITTTPKALPHVKALVKRSETDKAVVVTRGHTMDNAANLSGAALAELQASYDGTRLGRQELAGELLEDVDGAQWTTAMFEWDGFRVPLLDVPELGKRVLALDPAVTSSETSDQYGLAIGGAAKVNAGKLPGMDGRLHVYALHAEEFRATPNEAMKKVAERFYAWECDFVIVETNNGGDYIPALLHTVDETIPVRKVHARKGKLLRAEPVSQLYEQHRVHHVGPASKWAGLESVMTTFTGDPNDVSPDMLDAHVYEVLALAGPKVRDSSAQSAAGVSRSAVARTSVRRVMPPRRAG